MAEKFLTLQNGKPVLKSFPSSVTHPVSQTAHGFTVGTVLYDNAGTWAKAKADDVITAEVVGIVSAATTDAFDLTTGGYVSGLSGLTTNALHFLSASTEGVLTDTEPGLGMVSKPLFWAVSASAGYFINYRGAVIGSDSRSIITHVCETFDVSAAQDLTTSYSDITHSDFEVTPVWSDSVIDYSFNLMIGSVSTYGIAHLQLLLDGVVETESPFTTNGFDSGGGNQINTTISRAIPSWGTTAKTLKAQAREYGGVHDAKLFTSYYMDGATSETLHRPTLCITERRIGS